MDARNITTLARRFAAGLTRRDAIHSLLAGGGAVALVTMTAPANVDARRKKRCKPSKAGAFCSQDKECCPLTTRRKCDVADNASNSDTTCCGAEGAVCGGVNTDYDTISPHCCAGFRCSTDEIQNGVPGICQKANSF